MGFYKKIVLLKQANETYCVSGKSASGILRIESDGIISDVYLSIINISARKKGEYFLYILPAKGEIITLPLGLRPTSFKTTFDSFFDFNSGFAAGVFFIEDDIPDLVLYTETERCPKSVSDLKKVVLDGCIAARKIKQKEQAQSAPIKPDNIINGETLPPLTEETEFKSVCPTEANDTANFSAYNDEVVATENYFEKDYENVRNENDDAADCGKKETEKEFEMPYGFSDEKTGTGSENYSEQNPYFDTVKEELNDIFDKFPEVTELKNCVPYSKWAKINYSSEKYYVVGVVSDGKKEKYICYGVPAKYSPEPPKELKGFCSFVPISVFDMNGDGYWMMFQDAVTGSCVRLNEHA